MMEEISLNDDVASSSYLVSTNSPFRPARAMIEPTEGMSNILEADREEGV
jgi:hypothetical protein